MLSVKEYLGMIKPYLSDMINDHKTQGEQKIQLTMSINFMSSKNSEETHTVHTKTHNVEIMMSIETDEIIIKELFKSFFQKYQQGLEEPMKRSEFVFDGVDLFHYHLQKISLNRGGSYIDSPKQLKNKKANINLKNNDNKCFQYALTVVLNYQNIKKDPQRISKIEPFINQYDWKEVDFPSHQKDWKSIALNVLFVPYNTEKIRLAYKSKYNTKRGNQVILLMITDGQKWHYLALKKLSALLRGINSNHKKDFYCLNCFHLYSTKNRLEKHEKVCNNHDYCYV